MANTFQQTVYMVGAATDGSVQQINVGKSDDGIPIYFELETQEIDFGNRIHLKKVSEQIAVFTNFGLGSLSAFTDIQKESPINMLLNQRVNIGKDMKLEGHFVTFRWFGESSSSSPIFEGISIEEITDFGMTQP